MVPAAVPPAPAVAVDTSRRHALLPGEAAGLSDADACQLTALLLDCLGLSLATKEDR